MWQKPIYDRTYDDIVNKTKKGYLNYTDLNRIEENIAHLAELMGVNVITKKWSIYSLPTSTDFSRIVNNITKIEEKITFTTYQKLPENPVNTYNKVNLIELLIACIKGDIELVLGNCFYCGDSCFAGSELI